MERKPLGWLQNSISRNAIIGTSRTTPFDPYVFPLGDKFPLTVPVFIEVSAGSRNKYEWNQEYGVLMLDRVLHSAVFYPDNYGFIPRTLCGDGDPLDILVIGSNEQLLPGCIVQARPIAYMVLIDFAMMLNRLFTNLR